MTPRFFLVCSDPHPLVEEGFQYALLTDGVFYAPAVFSSHYIPDHVLIQRHVVIGVRSFRVWPYSNDTRAGITLLDVFAAGIVAPAPPHRLTALRWQL